MIIRIIPCHSGTNCFIKGHCPLDRLFNLAAQFPYLGSLKLLEIAALLSSQPSWSTLELPVVPSTVPFKSDQSLQTLSSSDLAPQTKS